MSAGSTRPELWILFAAVVGAAWAFTRPPAPPAAEPARPARRAPALAALPPGAQLALRVDLRQVRQSALGAALTGGGREISGLGRLSEICGFDPTEQIEELAIALPEQRGEPALGIVATGDFDPERIIDCAAKVLSRRGGTPAPSRIGEFSSVRDRAGSGAEVAVRAGGPVIVGEGAYFRAMLDAADGRGATLLGDEAHATLREAVSGHGAIGMTFVTRPGWLARWVAEDEALAAPLGSVRAGALRIDLDPSPRATLLLSCPAEATCQALAKWAEQLIGKVRSGVEPDPISEAKLAVEPNAVRVQLGFDPGAVQKLVLGLLLEKGQ